MNAELLKQAEQVQVPLKFDDSDLKIDPIKDVIQQFSINDLPLPKIDDSDKPLPVSSKLVDPKPVDGKPLDDAKPPLDVIEKMDQILESVKADLSKES
jgi:hypothetical protein